MNEDVVRQSDLEPVGNELLLARALEEWLEARRTGAASPESASAPLAPELQGELRAVVGLASALQESASTVRPSDTFRASARARILDQIGSSAAGSVTEPLRLVTSDPLDNARGKLMAFPLHRVTPWLARTAAGLVAVVLAGGTTLTASANALPGDVLYGVKQATEALELQFAPDDDARARGYLRQAEARLDELSRLVEQRRITDVPDAAQRYEDARLRAIGTSNPPDDEPTHTATDAPPARATLEAQLQKHQDRIATIVADAPEPARAALSEALLKSTPGRERSEEVRRAIAEGDRPEPAEHVRQQRPGSETPSVTPLIGATASPSATATPARTPAPRADIQRADIQRDDDDQRRGEEREPERPGATPTLSVQPARGPREDSRSTPGQSNEREHGDDGERSQMDRLRPPAPRAPTEEREENQRTEESRETTRGRTSSGSSRERSTAGR